MKKTALCLCALLSCSGAQALLGLGAQKQAAPSDAFAIFSSTLGGAAPTMLISDPHREMNHAYISPDGTRLLFTRYNAYNSAGFALEGNANYTQTEAVICNANGSNCRSVQAPQPGVIFAGSVWASDGKSIFFQTNQTTSGKLGIGQYFLDTNTFNYNFISFSTDSMGDPDTDFTAVPAVVSDSHNGGTTGIYGWTGSALVQISNPAAAGAIFDTDAHLAPSGAVALFSRNVNNANYAIYTAATFGPISETRLSPPLSGSALDGAPAHFSSDGAIILFWHFDSSGNNSLMTMNADGTGRAAVPVPAYPASKYFLTEPSFFPNAGSSSSAQILYSGRDQNAITGGGPGLQLPGL